MRQQFLMAILMATGINYGLATAADSAQGGIVVERNYTLNQSRSITIGEPLVRAKSYVETITTRPAFTAEKPFSIVGKRNVIEIPAATELPVVDTRAIGGERYEVASLGPRLNMSEVAIQVGKDGRPSNRLLGSLQRGPLFSIGKYYRFVPDDIALHRIQTKIVSRAPGTDNFELLFNGIDGQGLRLQYREYTADDLARPAFSQDLSYPLSVQTIRFRKLVIHVEAVNDQGMTYRVAADGSLN